MIAKSESKDWFELTPVGLKIAGRFSREQWEELGRQLASNARSLMWLVGDWLVAGEDSGYLPRGKLEKAASLFDISYNTAAQAVRVSRRIECCTRVQDLSWKHHQEVAGRDDATQLLKWAAQCGATVKQLAEEKKLRDAQATLLSSQSQGGSLSICCTSTQAEADTTASPPVYAIAELAQDPDAEELPPSQSPMPRSEPKSDPPEPAAEPIPAAETELDKMRTILRLASELSLENLAKIRESIDRLHDGKAGIKPEKIEPVAPAAQSRATLLEFDPLDMKMPEKFEGPRFRKAWTEWVAYNVEEKHPLNESVATKQMKDLASRSLDAAIAAIDKAIATRSKSFPAAKHSKPKFEPPTVAEVRQYVEQSGFKQVDPERFVSYYETQAWKLSNGNPMSDWRAAVRNWAGRRKEEIQNTPKSSAAVDGAYKRYQPEPDRRRPRVNQSATTGANT